MFLAGQTVLADSRLADQRNVIFERYTPEDGLSHASVTAIEQDQHGFIWIGTQEGLNRFDGHRFDNFYHRDDISGSISHNSIFDILSDRAGNIWIGTDGGLNKLDQSGTRFDQFELNLSNERSKTTVYTLLEDTSGTLWVGTSSGLAKRLPNNSFIEVDIAPEGQPKVSIRRIFQDSRDIIWLGTERHGLYRFDETTEAFQRVEIADVDGVRDLIEDSAGNLWISGPEGISVLNPDNGLTNKLAISDNTKTNISTSRVRKLLYDGNGDVWIGSANGLHLYDTKLDTFVRYQQDKTDIHSLSDNNVIELFQDKGGVVWVGTFNGLSRFNARIVSFPKFQQSDNTGLKSNAITSFADEKDNDVWIGTLNGLHKWDAKTARFHQFTSKNSGISDNRIMSLANTPLGLWVGTMAGGINLLTNQELAAVMQHDPLDNNSISSNAISKIHLDKQGSIWVATYGAGVNKYLGAGQFERFPKENVEEGTFSDLKTVDIVSDSSGKLWIATNGGGLIVLDPRTGKTKTFQNDPATPGSISSDNVISLLFHEGTLWAGTRDRGLNKYLPDSESFQTYTRVLGLASDLVYGILGSSNGDIWISGGKGLSVLTPSTGNVQIYESIHGLQSDDFNNGAFKKLTNGTFLFGGNNGFNAFFPEKIRGNEYVPPVRITQFRKFNKKVSLKKPIYKQDLITLKHDDSVFGFEFASMDFTAPQKNRFRYRLEGFNRAWIEANDSHQVTYTNLDPGNYLFSLQGSNNDGVWNETGTSIEIDIEPPSWATWWAYAIYLAIALFLVRQALGANQARLRREAEKRYSERLQLYIESLEEATDCVLIADANKNLMYANDAITNILGISPQHAEGRSIMSLLFTEPADASLARENIKAKGRWHGEVFGRKGMDKITTEITIAAVKDDNGNETAFVSIARDVTGRKKVEAELETHRLNLQTLVDERTTALKHEIAENKAVQVELANSLEEKELLLKEVHHRVKNNMQVISSLLNIQAETVDDDVFSGLLGESQQRIKSMSLIHENLYQSDNLLEIDFEDYINMLANSLHRFYSVPNVVIGLDIQVFNVSLDIETAVPCGLIINELISNAFKHAFKGRTGKGLVSIVFTHSDNEYCLRIRDNGNGLPEGFSLDTQSSMGTEIVVILTQQIGGQISYSSTSGTEFQIVFPKKNSEKKLAMGT